MSAGERCEVAAESEAEAVSPAELSSLPTCTLTPSQLGDLELLLTGAYAPLTGFLITRWHGTIMETGFFPFAAPTAREARALPSCFASCP